MPYIKIVQINKNLVLLGGTSSLGVGVGVGMGIGLGPPNGLGILGHSHQGTLSMMHTHTQRLHPGY